MMSSNGVLAGSSGIVWIEVVKGTCLWSHEATKMCRFASDMHHSPNTLLASNGCIVKRGNLTARSFITLKASDRKSVV